MKRIGHLKDCEGMSLLPEVRANLEINLTILDTTYGTERNLVQDLGGYTILAETIVDIQEIQEQITKGEIPEYVDVINCRDGQVYCSSLFILSSDYGVIVIATKELTDVLLEGLEE